MSIRSGLITGVAAALVIGVALWGYGHHQYKQGVSDTKTDYVLAQISIEQGMQYERDRADAEHRGAVMARDLALRDLSGVRGELDWLLSTYGGGTKDAGDGSRSDGVSTDWIGGFAACYAEYADLARDAAGWADQVNGLQGYIKALRK